MTADQRLSTSRLHAERIAQRVAIRYGCDPLTIISIVLAVINIGLRCWQITHPTMAHRLPHEALVQRHRENPAEVRRDFRAAIKREFPNLTKPEVDAYADEALAEALSDDNADDFNALVKAET